MAEQWLTYQQAGELLGMSANAVRQRARRLMWRVQPGNDGRVLVFIPDGVAVRPRVRPAPQAAGRAPEQAPGQSVAQTAAQAAIQAAVQAVGHPAEIDALREVIVALRTQLAKAEAVADEVRRENAAERQRYMEAQERWEARLDGLAANLAEVRQARLAEAEVNARREVELQRVQAEMERLRGRPSPTAAQPPAIS
jgi:hypothetical protein